MSYAEWCPVCSEPIILVTRGVPSMGSCANGHSTDRRDVLRRKPVATDPRIDGWNAAIEAAMQQRNAVADMIGARPCSSIHSALCEYANTIRAIPCPYTPKEGKDDEV